MKVLSQGRTYLFREGAFMPDMNCSLKDLNLSFIPKNRSLSEVLTDNNLAALGDALVNFIYSLALSLKEKRPVGRKLDNVKLASALRKAGLRKILPHRVDRHRQANAAEALIVYAWIMEALSLREILRIMSTSENIEDSLGMLLQEIVRKIWGS